MARTRAGVKQGLVQRDFTCRRIPLHIQAYLRRRIKAEARDREPQKPRMLAVEPERGLRPHQKKGSRFGLY